MQSWLDHISPRLNILWRGAWPAHVIEPARSLYDHELVCVTKGAFSLQIKEEHFEMREGSFALIPPRTIHVSRVLKGEVLRSCLHFDWVNTGAPRRPICSFYPKKPAARLVVEAPDFVPVKIVVGRFDSRGAVPALLETIFQRWQTREAFDRSLCRGPFLELLVQLFWEQGKSRQRRNQSSQLAYAAKERLDTQGVEGRSIRELLSSLGCSYEHISRLFHKNFGLTPVEYLNAKKMERAKMLLRNPRLSIAEVAYQSGFRDSGYFIRKFREQTGLTPGRYRCEVI